MEKENQYVEFGIALDCIERLNDLQLKALHDAVVEERQNREVLAYGKSRAEKYPVLYKRLCTMPGITHDEREQCLRDFFGSDNEVIWKDSDNISLAFSWDLMPSGEEFWDAIDDKVNDADNFEES